MTLYNTTQADKTLYAYRLIVGDERIGVIWRLLDEAGCSGGAQVRFGWNRCNEFLQFLKERRHVRP